MNRETLPLINICLGGKKFGLKVNDIVAIIRLPQVAKLPGVPEYILGAISFRGTVLTVVDLGRFLGEELSPGLRSQAIIIRAGEWMFGILADTVSEIKDVPVRKIERVARGGCFSGSYILDGEKVRIIDVGKILKISSKRD